VDHGYHPDAKAAQTVNRVLRGDKFELTVTEDPRRRRQPATFSVRLRIPRVHYDRTTRGLHGRLDVRR